MKFSAFFVSILILLFIHVILVIFSLSSRSKHFYSKLKYAKKYMVNNKIKLNFCFFKILKRKFSNVWKHITIILTMTTLLLILTLVLNGLSPNKQLVNPFTKKENELFIILFVLIIFFYVFDWIYLGITIYMTKYIKDWITINDSFNPNSFLENLFEEDAIVEQVDLMIKTYSFRYKKLSFHNTFNTIKDRYIKEYVYFWMVQDYDTLKINDKKASLNMFYDIYTRTK